MSSAIHLWPGYTKKTGRGEGASETKARVTQDVDDAFEALLQGQPDLSLKMESDLEEVLRITELIKSELDVASAISELERLDRRIEFIEDRFEEPEAELYNQPRRRRKRRPNLFDFFRQPPVGDRSAADSGQPGQDQGPTTKASITRTA